MSYAVKRPWHLWLIGVVGTIWNAGGVFDYIMTQTKNESYLSQFTPEQLEYFFSFPMSMQITWAIAVFGAMIGCILLLLKMRLAFFVLLISFLAMVVTTIHNFFIAEVKMYEVVGQEAIWVSAIIFAVSLLLLFYARAMEKKGVLR